ncbi:MAG: transcription elongation factor GreA, partial [Oscillospiraceae bacterium]|nr:transcription elongation factor GreA [Oscillospiraceae bacterium]
MYDQLTKEDIALMRAELYDLETNKRPAIIAEVQRCREFGDLSENYEYKAAKQEQRAMDSRIRYLNNMIRTARIVEQAPADEDAKGVRLFDKVTIYIPEDEEEMVIR